MSNEDMVKEAIDKAKEEKAKEQSPSANDQNIEEKNQKENAKNEETSDKKTKPSKSKKDKKDEKIEKLELEIKELKDVDLRRMAEFENFRKRTEKEKTHMYTVGAKEIIEKVLPILDNFERGFKDIDNPDDPFVKGMEMIFKQFQTSLEEMGVKEIESDGCEFDPNLHSAVMHEDNPDLGENIITETLQKGYTYKDEVVRYAMVKVAN